MPGHRRSPHGTMGGLGEICLQSTAGPTVAHPSRHALPLHSRKPPLADLPMDENLKAKTWLPATNTTTLWRNVSSPRSAQG